MFSVGAILYLGNKWFYGYRELFERISDSAKKWWYGEDKQNQLEETNSDDTSPQEVVDARPPESPRPAKIKKQVVYFREDVFPTFELDCYHDNNSDDECSCDSFYEEVLELLYPKDAKKSALKSKRNKGSPSEGSKKRPKEKVETQGNPHRGNF